MSLDGKIRATRHEHFEADVPVVVAAVFRTTSKDLRATDFDFDLLAECLGFRRGRRAGLHARANEHLVLVPTLYRDASVLPAVDSNRATGRERLLSDFAVTD